MDKDQLINRLSRYAYAQGDSHLIRTRMQADVQALIEELKAANTGPVSKMPYESINNGKLGFATRPGQTVREAIQEECERCGWTADEYLAERDRRVSESAAAYSAPAEYYSAAASYGDAFKEWQRGLCSPAKTNYRRCGCCGDVQW